jgi:hypothetical protein
MNRVQLAGIGVLAGALTIVGAVGPWATGELLRHDVAGTDANRGVTVAVAAGVGLIFLAFAGWKNLRWAAMLAAVAALISFGLTVWTLAAINNFVGAPNGLSIGKGWGIWLATIASLVMVICAVLASLAKDPEPGVEVPADRPLDDVPASAPANEGGTE